MSDRTQAESRRLFLTGWVVILFVFGGLTAWSVFAPFEGAVAATGSMAVESNLKSVQHLEGGIVGEILVRDGDVVDAGEVLLRLDGTAARAALARLEARLSDLIAREIRLAAEGTGSDTYTAAAARRFGLIEAVPEPVLNAEAELMTAAAESRPAPMPALFSDLLARETHRAAEGTWSAAYAEAAALSLGLPQPVLEPALNAQAELMAARAKSRATQVLVLQQRVEQLTRRIDGLRAEVSAKWSQASMIEDEVIDLEILFQQGYTPKSRILALKRERSELLGEREALEAEIAGTRVQIGEAELEILQLTEGEREKALEELSEVRTQIAELQEERAALMDQIARLEITAPRAGKVLGVKAHTVGGVIRPGDPVMHIVPEGDKLVARVRFSPQDIDKVTAGQEATLRFTAFSQGETPEVKGLVAQVSADAIQDEKTGQSYFEGIVKLPDNPVRGDLTLVPGMPVDAMVKTSSRNVLSYLTKPMRDAMARTFRE